MWMLVIVSLAVLEIVAAVALGVVCLLCAAAERRTRQNRDRAITEMRNRSAWRANREMAMD
jgi:hypothetical protein